MIGFVSRSPASPLQRSGHPPIYMPKLVPSMKFFVALVKFQGNRIIKTANSPVDKGALQWLRIHMVGGVGGIACVKTQGV